MEFPKEIASEIQNDYKDINILFEYSKHLLKPDYNINASMKYKLINCGQLYPGIKHYKEIVLNDLIWSVKHPYQYKPYQLMHFNNSERDLLDKNPPYIKFGF